MIRIHNSTDGQFYFTVTAANNKVLVTSETYTRRENALKGAMALYEVLSSLWNETKGLEIRDFTDRKVHNQTGAMAE